MFTHHYVEGLVVSETAKGESDKIFNIYTREFGKISLLGKSIRKEKSKLKMNLQLFSHVKVGFIEGRVYNTITDVSSVSVFKNAKNHLGKLSLFYRISELMLSFMKGEEKDEKVFTFLLNAFQKINETELSVKELELFYCFFSFQILRLLGYEPRIQSCILCRKGIKKECYFDSKRGGVVCNKCFKKGRIGVYLEDVRVLSFFLNLNIKDFPQSAKAPVHVVDEFLSFVSESAYLKK